VDDESKSFNKQEHKGLVEPRGGCLSGIWRWASRRRTWRRRRPAVTDFSVFEDSAQPYERAFSPACGLMPY
jgi:hypothetical protein